MGFSGEHYAAVVPCTDDTGDDRSDGAGGSDADPKVRIELPSSHVRALMEAGRLRVEGLRCLDTDTKKVIRHLCLECCRGNRGQGKNCTSQTSPAPSRDHPAAMRDSPPGGDVTTTGNGVPAARLHGL